MTDPRVAVVLPALDEEGAVSTVVAGFRRHASRVVVVDNGSKDATARRARAAGAEVVTEPRRGYGAACLAGVAALATRPPEVVVFSDCDGTSDPDDLPALVEPVLAGRADLVLGNRREPEAGALPLPNRVARGLSRLLLRLLYGLRVRDLPPLRAIRFSTLARLGLRHPTYGFPLETVALASRSGARIVEVPVRHRRRATGRSKVGTNPLQVAWIALLFLVLPLRFRIRRLPA